MAAAHQGSLTGAGSQDAGAAPLVSLVSQLPPAYEACSPRQTTGRLKIPKIPKILPCPCSPHYGRLAGRSVASAGKGIAVHTVRQVFGASCTVWGFPKYERDLVQQVVQPPSPPLSAVSGPVPALPARPPLPEFTPTPSAAPPVLSAPAFNLTTGVIDATF